MNEVHADSVPPPNRPAAVPPVSIDKSISGPVRWVLALCGVTLISMLIVARMIPPDPRGFGTHEQLFLNPCGFKLATGLLCPSCGMTTSWSHATRGQWLPAMQTNPAGALMAIAALVLGPWGIISAVRGRFALFEPKLWIGVTLLTTIGAVALVHWLLQLLN